MHTNPASRLLLFLGTALTLRLNQALKGDDRERGDVPGWVMITLMSATLVAFILVMAQEYLGAMFEAAMAKVNNP